MKQATQSPNRIQFNLAPGPQAKQVNAEEFDSQQSPLETKNTTTFSFQDNSILFNKSTFERDITSQTDRIATYSALLSQKDINPLFLSQKQNSTQFSLKLQPLISQQSIQIQDENPSPAKEVNQSKKLALSKKSSMVDESNNQTNLMFKQISSQTELNMESEQVTSPTRSRLQYLLQKNAVSLECDEDLSNNVINTAEDEVYKQNSEQLITTNSNSDVFNDLGNYSVLKTFTAGDSFGELRLFEKNQIQGILVTESECQIIEITKEGFQSILAKYQASELQEQIDFFKSFSFFKDIPVYSLMNLIGLAKVKQLTRGDVLYQEKDVVDSMYFIKDGEVEVSKLILEEVNHESEESNNKIIQIPKLNLQSLDSSLNSSPLLKERSRKDIIPLKQVQSNKKRISLKILTSISYLGQEEIIHKILRRENKATVLSPSACVYIVNKQDLVQLITKHGMLKTLMEESSIKEKSDEQRKKLIKNVQVKIQRSQTCQVSPKSQRELKSPISKLHNSYFPENQPLSHRGFPTQYSSAVFDSNPINKSGNTNTGSHRTIPLIQCQNTLDERHEINNFSETVMKKINSVTQPNSHRGSISPRLQKLDSNQNSPRKDFIIHNQKASSLSNIPEDFTEFNKTQRGQKSYQQFHTTTDYSSSPMTKISSQKQSRISSPRVIRLQSGIKSNLENFQALSNRASQLQSQTTLNQTQTKTVNSLKAFDFDSTQKLGNSQILMIQFKTDADSKQQDQTEQDDYQMQQLEKKEKKVFNLKAIFKSPNVKRSKEDQLISDRTQYSSNFFGKESHRTIRRNDNTEKNQQQQIYYDLSPIKKQILTSLQETNKQNKIGQNNQYNKSVSPLKQLPIHPDILTNIPRKFWKENQKLQEQNEQMYSSGSQNQKRQYLRAGRQSEVQASSLFDRNKETILQIARQATAKSPKFHQKTQSEACQMNIGRINVQNLERQIKNIQK